MLHNTEFLFRITPVLRRTKIQYRLLAIFCFISLVPVICVCLFSYRVYTNSINNIHLYSDSTLPSMLADGSVLAGTKNGMLAVIKKGKVFRLGAVCNDGPVHDIAVSPDGKKAFGVAGDRDSLGMIFTYDAENGVELGGCIRFEDGSGRESVGVSCEPCCIAVSPDGKRVAIGVRDHLGCVYEFEV